MKTLRRLAELTGVEMEMTRDPLHRRNLIRSVVVQGELCMEDGCTQILALREERKLAAGLATGRSGLC